MNSTREAYGQALAELGEKYRFMYLTQTCQKPHRPFILPKKFPERFTNMGIAESNMIATRLGTQLAAQPYLPHFRGIRSRKSLRSDSQ